MKTCPRIASIDLGATWLRTANWYFPEPDIMQRWATTTAEDCGKVIDNLLEDITENAFSNLSEPLYIAMSRAPDLSDDGIILDWPLRPDWIGQAALSTDLVNNKNGSGEL